MAAAHELAMTLVKYDHWFEELIPALRKVGQEELANLLDDPRAEGPENHNGNVGPPHRPQGVTG